MILFYFFPLGERTLRFRFEDTSVEEDDEMVVENQWLIFDSLPDKLKSRYSDYPSRIYVRQCYRDIYEMVTTQMLDDKYNSPPAFLFTGVPGIGKSIFLVYFLCRYLLDIRFPDKRFVLEFERGEYLYFTPTGVVDVYDLYVLKQHDFPIEDVLLLSDMIKNEEPRTRGKWTLLFCPPNLKRYKQTRKIFPFFRYILPVWSYDELKTVNENEASWSSEYEEFGGVARSILRGPIYFDLIKGELREKLRCIGHTVMKLFMKRNFGAIDIDTSYALVHINPPRSEDGKYIYTCLDFEYTFASMYVFRKLMTTFKKSQLMEVSCWFNTTEDLVSQKYGGSFAGDMFEWLCLFQVPLCERKLSCESLGNNQNPLGNFVVPEIELLSSIQMKEGNLHPMVLYVPKASNFESGDAFCTIEVDGVKVLLVFQITIASSHPVRANGLVKIFNAFPEDIRNSFQRKIILFVTPSQGKLCSWQPLWTVKGETFKDVTKIPAEAKNFEQWFYRYTIVISE